MRQRWTGGFPKALAAALTLGVMLPSTPMDHLRPTVAHARPASPTAIAAARGAMMRLSNGPIVENRGQFGADVEYHARAGGATAFFGKDGIRYELIGPRGADPLAVAPSRSNVHVTFLGARGAVPVAHSRTPTVFNFHVGPETDWVSNVPSFERLTYRDLWPGIDMVHEATDDGLRYRFELGPGADPRLIRLAVGGATGVRVDGDGRLVIATEVGELLHEEPFAYQESKGHLVEVGVQFVLSPGRDGTVDVTFGLDPYDTKRPLVIDPLIYAGFLGAAGYDQANAVALGPGGIVHVAGSTEAIGVVDINAFVARVDAAGTALLSMTYLGGNWIDAIHAIAVDGDGNSYVAGSTGSTNLAIVNGFDAVCGNGASCEDAFMMKLTPAGALLYSTYLGGSQPGIEIATGIAIDAQRRAVVVGTTASSDFPVKNALYPVRKGPEDGFISKIDPALSGQNSHLWSTFLGGSGNDGLHAVAVDADGSVWVTGFAGGASTDYPLVNPIHGDRPGTDVVVTKLSGNGNPLLFSTYLGSDAAGAFDYEIGYGIAVDALKNAYVTGIAAGPNFPTTPGSFKPQCQQVGSACFPGQGFVTKLGPQGQMLYSTYLGSDVLAGVPSGTSPEAIAVDQGGRAYVTGTVADPAFKTTPDALDSTCGTDGLCNLSGGAPALDAFVAVLDPTGAKLSYATFLGGHGHENDAPSAGGIAVGLPGEIYVVGATASAGTFPATPAAWDTTLDGNYDGFLVKLAVGTDLSVKVSDNVDPVHVNGLVVYTALASNDGPEKATHVAVPVRFLGRVKYKVQAASLQPAGLGACVIVGGQRVDCSMPLLAPAEKATISVTVQVLSLPGGQPFEKLAAIAEISADQPDPKPANNKTAEGTMILP